MKGGSPGGSGQEISGGGDGKFSFLLEGRKGTTSPFLPYYSAGKGRRKVSSKATGEEGLSLVKKIVCDQGEEK